MNRRTFFSKLFARVAAPAAAASLDMPTVTGLPYGEIAIGRALAARIAAFPLPHNPIGGPAAETIKLRLVAPW